jgi:hypothetical protein
MNDADNSELERLRANFKDVVETKRRTDVRLRIALAALQKIYDKSTEDNISEIAGLAFEQATHENPRQETCRELSNPASPAVQRPIDGHGFTGDFTAEEFLKRADEHDKAARNGMSVGPNVSYVRTFQACAVALRLAAPLLPSYASNPVSPAKSHPTENTKDGA